MAEGKNLSTRLSFTGCFEELEGEQRIWLWCLIQSQQLDGGSHGLWSSGFWRGSRLGCWGLDATMEGLQRQCRQQTWNLEMWIKDSSCLGIRFCLPTKINILYIGSENIFSSFVLHCSLLNMEYAGIYLSKESNSGMACPTKKVSSCTWIRKEWGAGRRKLF